MMGDAGLGTLYFTDDPAHATSPLTAAQWGQSQWLPSLFLPIILPIVAHFLIVYEHILHAPVEWHIWARILQRKRLTKAFLPWSTIWLRYSTLALGILGIVNVWDNHQTAKSCRNNILPALFAWLTIVSMSTGAAAVWRCLTIARAAFPSSLSFWAVKICCLACLLARLASQMTAYTIQIRVSNAIFDELAKDKSDLLASCFAQSVSLFARMRRNEPDFSGPSYAYAGLLATAFATDMIFAGLTLACIWKLSKSVNAENSLLNELLRNSLQFYSLLGIVDLFALIMFAITRQANAVMFMVASGAILMIRVLIREQECISAHNRTYTTHTKTPWLTVTRERERGAADGNVLHVGPAVRGTAAPTFRAHRGDGCGCRRPRHYHHHHHHHTAGMQVRRRGAGLTDIERVTVLEHGRSVDRPWLAYGDEEQTWKRNTYAAGPGGHLEYGLESLIAEWTREVNGAMHSNEDVEECSDERHLGPNEDYTAEAEDGDDDKGQSSELSSSGNIPPFPPRPAHLLRPRSSSLHRAAGDKGDRLYKSMY